MGYSGQTSLSSVVDTCILLCAAAGLTFSNRCLLPARCDRRERSHLLCGNRIVAGDRCGGQLRQSKGAAFSNKDLNVVSPPEVAEACVRHLRSRGRYPRPSPMRRNSPGSDRGLRVSGALSRSRQNRPRGYRTRNRRAARASREPKCPRRIGQPSRRGQARPDRLLGRQGLQSHYGLTRHFPGTFAGYFLARPELLGPFNSAAVDNTEAERD